MNAAKQEFDYIYYIVSSYGDQNPVRKLLLKKTQAVQSKNLRSHRFITAVCYVWVQSYKLMEMGRIVL